MARADIGEGKDPRRPGRDGWLSFPWLVVVGVLVAAVTSVAVRPGSAAPAAVSPRHGPHAPASAPLSPRASGSSPARPSTSTASPSPSSSGAPAAASPGAPSAILASSTIAGAPAPVPVVSGNRLVDARTGAPLRLLGVDVSGTEDACIEQRGISWGPDSASEAAGIASWHVNAVRVPLNEDCWLGINGVPAQYSGRSYQSAVEQWVADLNAAGMVAILDLHWSAPGTIPATGQWPMADEDHSVTFWTQVAAAFAGSPSVIFDLFNEPFLGGTHPSSSNWSCWLDGCTTSFVPAGEGPVSYTVAGMQQLLNAVRSTGARQPVMVGGLNWAGDPCGLADAGGNGNRCAWVSDEPADPDRQLVASFHTYSWTACTTPSCWNSDVKVVAGVVPVVTGEIGESDCSAQYVNQFMPWADANGVSYLAWSWQPDAGDTSCPTANMKLVTDWSGAPNPNSAVAAVFKAHLAQEWSAS